jgi:16S rRNA (cytidine1402-2'-O)-methyltransferase
MGTLYLVATPIGNLEDITGRALRVLREARLVAAEDTRQSKKLLEHYQIQQRLVSYHEHNKLSKLDAILTALAEGDVALVSDAGMPAINDPGYELVRAALAAGYPVSPIPGPSAPVAALAASGLPTDAFLYLGYLPRKTAERRKLLRSVAALPYTLIFLEAPHRVLESLADLRLELGDRPCAIARELTKLYEEIWRGALSGAIQRFTEDAPRGEFTLVIGGNTAPQEWDEPQVRAALQEKKTAGISPSQAAAEVAAESGWNKRAVYRLAME